MPSVSGFAIKSRQDAESLLVERLKNLGLLTQILTAELSQPSMQETILDAITELVLADCICAKINGTLYTFGAVYERLYGETVSGVKVKRKASV